MQIFIKIYDKSFVIECDPSDSISSFAEKIYTQYPDKDAFYNAVHFHINYFFLYAGKRYDFLSENFQNKTVGECLKMDQSLTSCIRRPMNNNLWNHHQEMSKLCYERNNDIKSLKSTAKTLLLCKKEKNCLLSTLPKFIFFKIAADAHPKTEGKDLNKYIDFINPNPNELY